MSELAGIIQAVLFAAAEPLDLATITAACGYPEEDVRAALDELEQSLTETGLRLQSHAQRWQLTTSSAAADAVKRYLGQNTGSDLSKAALETLAMIAYRGPISRAELDDLRGVSSDTMLKNLLQRELILEQRQATGTGRTMAYVVSHRLLQHLGLNSLSELPPLAESDHPHAS